MNTQPNKIKVTKIMKQRLVKKAVRINANTANLKEGQ